MPEPGGTAHRCAVLGDPVAHSLSPTLHRAGYDALGLSGWTYDAHRVPAGGLAAFLSARGAQWRGLSLTMPLKREAIALVDDLTARARRAGAVNTLVVDEGTVLGDNTDLPGAAAAIRERTDLPLGTGVLLGGGATATSTGLALCELGVSRLVLAVRDPGRARETVEALTGHPSAPDVEVVQLSGSTAFDADVVVSTVPALAQDERLVARCAGVPVVLDVVYDPWPTPLAASAGDRVLVSGLDLLLHQAGLQFTLFTGHEAPLEPMRQAGEAALARRGR